MGKLEEIFRKIEENPTLINYKHIKELKEAEASEDNNYKNYCCWDKFSPYISRMGTYHRFLQVLKKNPDIVNSVGWKKWKRFFLRKMIRSGEKAISNGFGQEIKITMAKTAKNCLELAKNGNSINFVDKYARKSRCLVEESLENISYYNDDIKKEVYGYAGNIFSGVVRIKISHGDREKPRLDSLKNSNLEDLIMGIIYSELSEKFGNHAKNQYQVIGRECYDLQYLIEKTDINLLKEDIQKVKNNMVSEPDFRDYFSRFWLRERANFETISDILDTILLFEKENSDEGKEEIRKRDIKFAELNCTEKEIDIGGVVLPKLDLIPLMGRQTKENPDDFKKELQLSVIYDALKAFKKSEKVGDSSPGNRSYIGACLVDLMRLNNRLHKFDKEECREMLEEARHLLEKVLERGEVKDYTRLSECYFRLADSDITWDKEERKKLHKKIIKLNKEDIKYSYVAFSHYKLAELSTNNNEKKQELNLAVNAFKEAYKKGDDKFPENRSKTGSCYLGLLELELEENKHSLWKRAGYGIFNLLGIETKIDRHINQAKDALEEAIEKGKNRRGGFIYPYCLLAELSDSINDNKIRGYNNLIKRYNWEIVVEKLFENKKNLKEILVPLFKEKLNVSIVNDEYGLMRRELIVKESENEGDLKQEFLRNRFIYDAMKKSLNLASDSVPFSMPINFIQKDDKYYYVMRRSKGINLDQKFKFFVDKYA